MKKGMNLARLVLDVLKAERERVSELWNAGNLHGDRGTGLENCVTDRQHGGNRAVGAVAWQDRQTDIHTLLCVYALDIRTPR